MVASREHLNFENAHLDTFKGCIPDVHSQSWGVYRANLNQVKVLIHELVLSLQHRPRD